jgi:hypothetical protein
MLHTKHNQENTACRQNSRRKRSKCRRRKRHAEKKRKQNGRQRQGKEWDEQSNAKRKHNQPCNLWSATESY